MFSMLGTVTYLTTDYTYSYSLIALGFGASVDYEMLLTPDLSFNIGAGYRLGLVPMVASLTVDDTDFDLTEDYSVYFNGVDFEDMSLAGMRINLGVNYALAELPFNLFGFLDPFKKY